MFVADFIMEAKFSSFVESFYLSLSDMQYEEAQNQVKLMKKWYGAYSASIQSAEKEQIDKQLIDNMPLYEQVKMLLSCYI